MSQPRLLHERSCAICGSTFRPWKRLQPFCSLTCFGRSNIKPPPPCEQCGKPVNQYHRTRNRFCGRACASQAATKVRPSCAVCGIAIGVGATACSLHRHTPKRMARQRKCAECAQPFIPYPSVILRTAAKFCSRRCHFAAQARRPAFIQVSCGACGAMFRRTLAAVKRVTNVFCSARCCASFYSGERSPMFRGGEKHRRGPGWQVNRRACRERDRICRRCAKTPELNGEALSVDHLIPWRLFADERMANDLVNLVALCRSCHGFKTNRVERAYVNGDVLDWLGFLRSVDVDPKSLVFLDGFLLPVGLSA